jgi:hypothetical protein
LKKTKSCDSIPARTVDCDEARAGKRGDMLEPKLVTKS